MQTTGIPLHNRIDMELVSEPCISKALCIDFRASVTILWQVIKHLLQRHVTAAWRSSRVLSFGGRLHPSAGVPACVSLASDHSCISALVSRAQGSQWSHGTCPTILSPINSLTNASCIRPGRLLGKFCKSPRKGGFTRYFVDQYPTAQVPHLAVDLKTFDHSLLWWECPILPLL